MSYRGQEAGFRNPERRLAGSQTKAEKAAKAAAKSPPRVSKPLPPAPADTCVPRKRVARGTREQRIVEAAIELFSEEGFRASTRELAGRLGVTQALLYRYFKTKQELIDRVFAEVFVEQWDARAPLSHDASTPLAERLTEFYQAFARRFSSQRARLFLRAELDDQKLAARYTLPLNELVLIPIVEALRQQAGIPPTAIQRLLRAERELAMTLHGAIAHLGLRKHVYGSPLPDDLDAHVAFYVDCFLSGAIPTLKRMHDQRPDGLLGDELTPVGAAKIE